MTEELKGEAVEVVGYINPENIDRVKSGEWRGFMVEDEADERRTCAVMTVAQHQRLMAAKDAEIARLSDELDEWFRHCGGDREDAEAFRAQHSAPAERGVVDGILELILDECKYWHNRDEARRGNFASLYASAQEVARLNPAIAEQRAGAVLVPDGCRQKLITEGKPYPRSNCAACGQFAPKWKDCNSILSAAPALPVRMYSVKDLQKMALAAGLQYVREPDDHYVTGTTEQAIEFIRDTIGVDARISAPSPAAKRVGVPVELLERVAKPVLLRSQEDAHADACAELRALLATDTAQQQEGQDHAGQ